jgi:hypothetical protein
MHIRKARAGDLDALMAIFAAAKMFMKKTGNGNQWVGGYPDRELIAADIRDGNSFVCVDDGGGILATFFFQTGPDQTYARIYDGQWLNDGPYGVVHRIAGSGKARGVSDYCLQWCLDRCGNVRIDTHQDNRVMRNALIRNGYTYCGIIYIKSGDRRLAFQKCEGGQL